MMVRRVSEAVVHTRLNYNVVTGPQCHVFTANRTDQCVRHSLDDRENHRLSFVQRLFLVPRRRRDQDVAHQHQACVEANFQTQWLGRALRHRQHKVAFLLVVCIVKAWWGWRWWQGLHTCRCTTLLLPFPHRAQRPRPCWLLLLFLRSSPSLRSGRLWLWCPLFHFAGARGTVGLLLLLLLLLFLLLLVRLFKEGTGLHVLLGRYLPDGAQRS
mmetsp:Transcript_86334/g.180668  ORF Transcript_86334/g.180668 Transcript_86334/m.180668 type:complete len:213 (-) Transcript_86334:1551-2189(-)